MRLASGPRPAVLGLSPPSALAALVVGACLLLSGVTGSAAAQAPPSASVVRVQHDPAGRIVAAVTASDQALLAPGNISVLVDGFPRTAKVAAAAEREPLPVVLAIDSSGSMAGAALTSAKVAASQLVSGLSERDPIAVLSFSDTPLLRARFGSNRAVSSAAVQEIAAKGDTSLYRAVDAATELASSGGTRGVVVLLSDGEDTTGGAELRAGSLRNAAARGVPVFAFGLGATADASYLRELAEASRGAFVPVASPNTLVTLYSQLGINLGRVTTVEVVVPPLPLGGHDVTIRLGQPRGSALVLNSRLEVDNAGLLQLAVGTPAVRAAPITLQVASLVPLSTLELRYSVAGAPLEASGAGTAQIDPWRRVPGETAIEVQAFAEGQLLASARTSVTVPRLEPEFTIEQQAATGGTLLTVRGNAQTTRAPSMVVRDGQRELLRTQEPVARLTVPAGSEVTVELRDGESLVRAQAVTGAGAGASLGVPLPPTEVLLLLAGFLAFVAFVLARRQSRFGNAAVVAALEPAPLSAPPVPRTLLPESWRAAGEHLPRLVIRGPNGQVRRMPVPTDVALTIGTNGSCDVRLEDDTVRPVHGRLTPFAEGHFVLQAVGLPAHAVADGVPNMLVVRPGEEVKVGRHVLVIE